MLQQHFEGFPSGTRLRLCSLWFLLKGELATGNPEVSILEGCSAAARRLHKRTTQAPCTGTWNLHQVALWLLVGGGGGDEGGGGREASTGGVS